MTAIALANLYTTENITTFVREAERVARSDGYVLIVEVARGWYGGELAPILFRNTWQEEFDCTKEMVLPQHGYQRMDLTSIQDFGTVENAVQTYAFIFGKAAIDYLQEQNKTTMQWVWSVFHKQVGKHNAEALTDEKRLWRTGTALCR